jgi:HEAT repeat protein
MDLADAARKLNDPEKSVRDDAMAAVLAARVSAVPHLVETLAIPGAPVAKIALLLAALNAREGLAKLFELLDKGILDVDTRAVVARALAELVDGRDAFDDAAKRSVLRLSKDPHNTTRQLTVKALEKIGDLECEQRLAEMAASDGDGAVKAAARSALASIRASRPVDSQIESAQIESGGEAVDFEALVKQQASGPIPVGEDAPTGPFASLVLKLRDPRWAVRNGAVDEAVGLGKQILPTLVDVLTGRNAGAKIGAAQAIARIAPVHGAQSAIEPLVDVVTADASSDDERALKPIALKALACSLTGGEDGLATPLLPLTRDEDPFVRAGALLCLGRLADRVGARAATLALSDPHDHVREAAAVALSEGTREEDGDLVLPLLAVLGGMPSPTVAVREAILLALARISVDTAKPDGPATLIRLRHRVRPSVLGMTASLRRTAIAILERSYAADDPPPIGVVDDVLGRLDDDHPEVRVLAASFLAQFMEPGLTRAVEKIEDALDRGERPLSLLSLDVLVKHDTAKAKAALDAACEDPDEAVASRAKELVATFQPKSEEWTSSGSSHASSTTTSTTRDSASDAKSASAPRAPSSTGAPHAPESSASQESKSEPPPLPRRVRAASGGGDVVEAKDAAVEAKDPASLKAQLDELKASGLSDDEIAKRRADLLDKF